LPPPIHCCHRSPACTPKRRRTPKGWTPLSYCRAKGKYGATEQRGIYPEVGVHRGVAGMAAAAGHGMCKPWKRKEQGDKLKGALRATLTS